VRSIATTAAAGCAAVVAVALAATGITSAAAAPTAPGLAAAKVVRTLDWTTCTNERLAAAKAECAMLKVPLDHARPNGEQIRIAVSRIKATAPTNKQQGPLLLNPGGPGGSGLTLPLYLNRVLPEDVRTTYDLIGFDPRGVGSSDPKVTCVPDYAKGPRPDYEPAGGRVALGGNEVQWLKRSAEYSAACAKKYGTLLPHLSTVDAVKDIDLLRIALGASRINFYGFSYGTYLGQVYATLFPQRTRRLVFDGVVDPTDVWYKAQLNQDKAFEGAVSRFFDWVASHDDVYDLGATGALVGRAYLREQNALRVAPVGEVGPAEWTDVFLPAGYAQFLWPDIAAAFAHWTRGDTKPVEEMYANSAAGDDNGYAMYLGVQCVDSVWPRNYRTWRADGFATAAAAPFETWGNVWFNTPCMTWAAPQGIPVNVNGALTPSLLLVNTTLDGATPYSGSLEVRRRFPHSALLAEVGNTTHANSLGGNACIDDKVFAYLRNGTLPTRKAGSGPDVECAASPLPKAEPVS
jgi:pimeloyl-ACP methyl ester carboxylesterase